MLEPNRKRERADIDSQLDKIRERSDKYRFDKATDVQKDDPQSTKETKPTPAGLAKQWAEVNRKVQKTRRDEIAPYLDHRHEMVYPPFMLTFGARGPAWKNRYTFQQFGPDFSRLGIEHPSPLAPKISGQNAPLLGPDDYGNAALFNRIPRSKRGYRALAHTMARWKLTQAVGPNPLSHAPDPTIPAWVKPCPKSSPFYTSGPRFPESTDIVTPGPGSYDLQNIRIGRRITAQHRLGHGAFVPLPFHVHCSHKKKEKCHMCKTEVWCLPTFYALPKRKIYLCPLCYFVERKMAITLKPQTIAKMRRVVDCAAIHTHYPDSDRVLTHATTAEIQWLARKELYMHLYFPKKRDPVPQKGVRRYAAP